MKRRNVEQMIEEWSVPVVLMAVVVGVVMSLAAVPTPSVSDCTQECGGECFEERFHCRP
jgi:hypothetical protein